MSSALEREAAGKVQHEPPTTGQMNYSQGKPSTEGGRLALRDLRGILVWD